MAGVETTSYVGGLVEANPTPEDFISQGDDHLRLIKTVLRNTFPGFSRAVDGALIPWQTTPDDTSVYQKFLNHDGQLGVLNDFISSGHALGALLRANNNLSDVQNPATALANLGGVADALVLKKANNLSDLADPAEARANLGVTPLGDALSLTANLADVPDKAIARVNLDVPQDSAVLKKADNLNSVSSKVSARINLDVPSNAQAALNADNLANLADVAEARDNLGVLSTADTITAINSAVVDNSLALSANMLLSWAYSTAFQLETASRDSNGAIITATIVWPDGALGVFTTDTASILFPGAIDAWHATHIQGLVTKLITQPLVTRNSLGAVTVQPAITVV